ncbi:hypothetical protein [Paraburkholderia sp. BL6665CI2N2]|uniref:hypothetical protein n=1 Tax=Paraburkholderia sp. BL6665CI2N2 TaxID=1938806 RepID=UPI001417095D|nr:hypothetical protein [Paraburkholderia sp. BL6665CI2N2]
MKRSGLRKKPDNQLNNKDLNAKAALDAKGTASKRVVQTFLNLFRLGVNFLSCFA